ncbi:c-type cytochrome biogenesis protein CcsB [Brevibacterium sp. Re57]|uniref:C-type cytochrome biogenesis protein CcsB n=2 Tax=Brevibacterium gallinarum TaxID=2762220 RepID=A0ABR8WQQ4_9MICO|nr:c-type cytochrome biogenesis protein CcsB [Brevibacterium gallinarum]
MDVNVTLATWSNLLVYSAMAVYAIAFLLYSSDLFAGRTLASSGKQTASGRVAAKTNAKASAKASAKAGTPVRTSRNGSVAVLDREDDAETSGTRTDGTETGRTGTGGPGEAATTASGTAGRRTTARMATALTVLAAGLHVAAVLTRALSVTRVPWGNMMEYALTASALAVLVYIVVLYFADIRYLGTFVAGGALVTLGLCITVFYTPAAQLVPALQSYWIWIHVPIAILSTALLSVSAILAVFQILKARTEQKDTVTGLGRMFNRVPASDVVEQLSYRIAAVGFVTWTFTVIAGAIWAEVAWGRPWGWDAKEIWSFVVWVVYAAYLHARATRGWSATQVAVLNIVGFSSLIFNFAIVNVYFDGLHSYSGL